MSSVTTEGLPPVPPSPSLPAAPPGMDISDYDDRASRQEILRQIFGDAGELIKDFSCAVESTVLLHGRMYITQKFICFYSNLFGLEKKIRIPFAYVTKITRENTALVIPNAIGISTHKKDYLFRSFWDREECYSLIADQMTKLKNRSSRRRSTRPEDEATSVAVAVTSSSSSTSTSVSSVTSAGGSASIASAVSTTTATSSSGRITSTPMKGEAPDAANTAEEDLVESETGTLHREPELAGRQSEEELQRSFQEHAEASRLKVSVVTDSLPVTISEYIALFIDDAAQFSYQKFQESAGDYQIVVSRWESLISEWQREIQFVKPIPQIASKTRAVKVQRYRRYGDIGFIICGSTSLEDVTAADTFVVEDAVVLKTVGEGRVSVEMYMQVKFIKSTWFKTIIESNTNSEVKTWGENYFKYMQKICSQKAIHLPQSTQSRTSLPKPVDSSVTATSSTSGAAGGAATTNVVAAASTSNSANASSVSVSASVAVATAPVTSSDHKMVSNSRQLPNLLNSLAEGVHSLLSMIDATLEKCGFGGGRVFWCAWLVLVLVFRVWSQSNRSLSGRVGALEARMDGLESSMRELNANMAAVLKALEAKK